MTTFNRLVRRTKQFSGAAPRRAPRIENVRGRPTLPRSDPRSTIGAERLSFRVRNGTGRFPLAVAAVTLSSYQSDLLLAGPDRISGTAQWTRSFFVVKPSAY